MKGSDVLKVVQEEVKKAMAREISAASGANAAIQPGTGKSAHGTVSNVTSITPKTVSTNPEIKNDLGDPDSRKMNEVTPPGGEAQVRALKRELPKTYTDDSGKRKESNPWAVAWASHNKESESVEQMVREEVRNALEETMLSLFEDQIPNEVEDPDTRYATLAAQFSKETGMNAPGVPSVRGSSNQYTDDTTQAQKWYEWLKTRNNTNKQVGIPTNESGMKQAPGSTAVLKPLKRVEEDCAQGGHELKPLATKGIAKGHK